MGGKLFWLTLEEKQQLGGFLQKDYTENKTVTFLLNSWKNALVKAGFPGFPGNASAGLFRQKTDCEERRKAERRREKKCLF